MKRFKHSLSNFRLLTADMGNLYPIGVAEVLPGDTFQQSSSALIRLTPQVAPVLHPVRVQIHHFFVPNRILWDGWEDFITGGPDGLGSSEQFPTILSPGVQGDLADYLGVPNVSGVELSAFPFRAYNLIYNEFYRDQDLCPEVTEDSTAIQKVAWEKDYFTASRPWTQKGPDVTLPVGALAPVKGLGIPTNPGAASTVNYRETGGVDRAEKGWIDSSAPFRIAEDLDNPGYPGVFADLADANAINVNEFREAFALQRYQEARARYGSRFTEYLRYLGVRPSDARLQRPEYLGGGKQTISFSEVLSTAETTGTVVGDLKGHGIAAVRSNRFRKYFEEHGHVVSLMSVRPKTMYTESVHKKFRRRTKEDYWQKELEQIGQQAVENAEVYVDGTTADAETFGYADRYREYREEPSIVTSGFRADLNYWHFARSFLSRPALNQSFVECDATKRPFADQSTDVMQIMVRNNIKARRLVRKDASSRII